MKCDASAPRPHRVGWCVGFGIAAAKRLDEWGVELKDFAKVSPELKRHLFNRAADTTEDNIEAARAFLNGFCDGVRAAHDLHDLHDKSGPFKWRLYCAFNWFKLLNLSRKATVKILEKRKLANESQMSDVLKILKEIGMPAKVIQRR